MFKSKWFTILIICFLIYAYVTQKQHGIAVTTDSALEKKFETIEKIKAAVESITADPEHLIDKRTPIIKDQEPGDKDNKIIIIDKDDSDKKWNIIQNKIYNAIYNIIHTSKGSEILDTILTSPKEEDKNGNKIEPNPYSNNSILNILDGEGESAECGDIVTIHYITRLVNGQEIENSRLNNKPKTFQIGNRKVIKGIEYALIGMKKGGIRRLIVPPRLGYINNEFSKGLVGNNEFITIDVELLDIKFALSDWKNKMSIYQTQIRNDSKRLLCSNEIFFHYKLSNTHEKIIAKSKGPVSFILGSAEVPPAINKAFENMKSDSKRTILLPSSLLYNKRVSFFPSDVKLPAKEALILEIDTELEIVENIPK
ncbi:MAG: FKBP-type peptidyl-prolyl cis-trans isomerase [Pseudomonadota bacterium]